MTDDEEAESLRLARERVLALLHSGPARELQVAIIGMALEDPDLELAFGVVVEAARHTDPQVRGNAILCIGHLARLHRSLPDDERAVAIVRAGLRDADRYVRGQAEAAADDVAHFMPHLERRVR